MAKPKNESVETETTEVESVVANGEGSITWVKENGNEIKTNDAPATIDFCKSLGWKQK